jgi:hypothetical protein
MTTMNSERKVINVDVGDMDVETAEQYVRRLMTEYWKRRDKEMEEAKANGIYIPPDPIDIFASFDFSMKLA